LNENSPLLFVFALFPNSDDFDFSITIAP